MQPEDLELMLRMISRMDRPTLARKLAEVRANFPVDFTAEFIETADLDRLRHIFFAVCLQARHMPGETENAAA